MSELENNRTYLEKLAGVGQSTAAERFFMFDNDRNNILQRFRPVLVAWWRKIRDNGEDWVNGVTICAPVNVLVGEEYHLLRFHRSPLQGVVDILGVISEHWNGKISWESWTEPSKGNYKGVLAVLEYVHFTLLLRLLLFTVVCSHCIFPLSTG